MDRRTAVPDAASVAPSNDRRAVHRAAISPKGEPANPGAVSVGGSNGRRGGRHAASSRTSASETTGAILAARRAGPPMVRNSGHTAVRPAARAATGRAMMPCVLMAPALMVRARTARVTMVRVTTVHLPMARGRRDSGATASPIRHARARTTTATAQARPAARTARRTAPRRRTHRAARSGYMACTRSPPRSPTPRAGCAALC
jgi:hypothetical protein